MTPSWLMSIFAALMLVIATVSAARVVAARPWRRGALIVDTDITHLLMAIAMAGMLSARLSTLPNTVWGVVFALMTGWFGYRFWRDYRVSGSRALAAGHCAPHLVHSAAMLYLFLAINAAPGGSGLRGMAGSPAAMPLLSHPTLAFVFGLILIGYTVWDLDQLSLAARGFTAFAVAGGRTIAGPAAGLSGAESAADGASSSGTGRSGIDGLLLAAGTTVACRVVMGTTMALMLFLML